jgi:hypothetical protein
VVAYISSSLLFMRKAAQAPYLPDECGLVLQFCVYVLKNFAGYIGLRKEQPHLTYSFLQVFTLVRSFVSPLNPPKTHPSPIQYPLHYHCLGTSLFTFL